MKKLSFLLLAFCFFTTVNAQIINFPDANFKARLLSANTTTNKIAFSDCQGNIPIKIDENNNGEIEKSEVINISGLYVDNSNISSIEGIIFFTNLSLLSIKNNLLNTIDVNSNNLLLSLILDNNPNLASIIIKNKFISFNVNNSSFSAKSSTHSHIKEPPPPCGAYGVTISNCQNLKYICGDESRLLEIQSFVNSYGYTNCVVNSYCSFAPGGTFYSIQGNQKLDSNNNGCDANDISISNFKYSITDGTTTGNIISDGSGNYSIPVQAGTHTITPIFENPNYYIVPPTSVNVTFPTQTSPFTQNFCITANGVKPDLEVTLLPLQPARPGFDAKYKLVYKNKGNTTQSGSVNLTFNDAVLDLAEVNPIQTSQNATSLSWNFSDLQPFETREISFTMNVNSPQEIPSVINGDFLAYTATITSSATDETPSDNTFTFNQIVVGSYDPNDKTCLEGSVISPNLIGQYVHYMIRFENTGTFAAENVVVKDMIDLTKFDISTLVPTSASHSFTTRISEGNKVEFIFENINLPFDDANNDGYIAFKIKTKSTLVVNDTFSNEANIYFDYNFPILTNKATSTFKTLGTPDFDFDAYFSAYPIPANQVLNLIPKKAINIDSISIYNNLGQVVLVITKASKVTNIDVSSLSAGNYFIKITTDKGITSTRFVKE